MKNSFYFVLWQLAWLPAILLDIPFLNKYGFLFVCIIVFLADSINRKLLKNQIEYQQICEVVSMMEMAYNDGYKRYKRQALFNMIIQTFIFLYMLMLFISLFTSYSDVSLIDYILWGAFVIWAGRSCWGYVKYYVQIRNAGQIILGDELQETYRIYKSERATHSFEEFLQPQPKHYKAMSIANSLFAMFSIIIGLLMIIIFYNYRNDIASDSGIVQFSMSIYSVLAVYSGVKDLLDTLSSQKYILLLLSCAIVALLYMPITHYLNKYFLAVYIADDPNLIYDAKNNLVQETITLDEIAGIDTTYLKQLSMLLLSENDVKTFLRKIIRTDAEYQLVFRDNSGNKQIVTISPNESKKLYNQMKSDLDILSAVVKSDFGNGTKIYDDGTYIVIEIFDNEKSSYPTQSGQAHFSTWLSEEIKRIAEYYDIAYFDKGLKVRLMFNNHQFIEQTLSLEELKMKKGHTGLGKSKKESSSIFNIFTDTSGDNNE